MQTKYLSARLFQSPQDAALARRVHSFRKRLFVDELGWTLKVDGDREQDQFDTPDAVHCALMASGGEIVGSFRAIRCDRPYLSASIFSDLAQDRPYPSDQASWEISRLGVLPEDRRVSAVLYAVMFSFAWGRRARALVALADLVHERLLRSIGVRTERYGAPAIIGTNRHGHPITALAGEIPMAEQSDAVRAAFLRTLALVDLTDETLVLGPDRVPA